MRRECGFQFIEHRLDLFIAERMLGLLAMMLCCPLHLFDSTFNVVFEESIAHHATEAGDLAALGTGHAAAGAGHLVFKVRLADDLHGMLARPLKRLTG